MKIEAYMLLLSAVATKAFLAKSCSEDMKLKHSRDKFGVSAKIHLNAFIKSSCNSYTPFTPVLEFMIFSNL